MKIAIIGTTSWGIVNFRGALIERLANAGHQVFAFALDYDEASRKNMRKLGGVPIDYAFSRFGMNPFVDIVNTLRLAKALKRISPDLVFSYFVKPVVFSTWAAVLAGIKKRIGMLEGLGYAFTEDQNGAGFKKKILREVQIILYRITFPFLQSLILLNTDDKNDLVDKNNIHIRQLHILGGIGLNLPDYPYSLPPVDPVSFIFVGRLIAEKGINEFVGAARKVREKHPSVKFFVVGAMDESNPGSLTTDALKRYIDEGLLICPGHVDDVVAWLTHSSVFVLPSYREGVPRSTQEAMAIGRPVITTDTPGCRETVIDGLNGFLVPPWSPDALAGKMVFFIENPAQIIKMGEQSYKLAQEKFDVNVVNQRLLGILLEN